MARQIVADICLYGTPAIGAGYLACRLDHGQISGTGEPVKDRGFTEAVWMAVEDLRKLGLERGRARIFAPGGDLMAEVNLAKRIPTFGDLPWGPAPVLSLTEAEIRSAAK